MTKQANIKLLPKYISMKILNYLVKQNCFFLSTVTRATGCVLKSGNNFHSNTGLHEITSSDC